MEMLCLGDLFFLARSLLKASNSQPYWEFLKDSWAKKTIALT